MHHIFEGIGTALVIIAIAVGVKGCMDSPRPMFGENGSIYCTHEAKELPKEEVKQEEKRSLY